MPSWGCRRLACNEIICIPREICCATSWRLRMRYAFTPGCTLSPFQGDFPAFIEGLSVSCIHAHLTEPNNISHKLQMGSIPNSDDVAIFAIQREMRMMIEFLL